VHSRLEIQRAASIILGFALLVLTGLHYAYSANAPASSVCVAYPQNPVLVPGPIGSWDSSGTLGAFVMFNGTHYNMWYSSFNRQWAIGFAVSTDGINWAKRQGPVLTAGPGGSWDMGGVYSPSVIWNGTTFIMYYTGVNVTTAWAIGAAFSKDMIHWQKYSGNPILTPGPGYYDSAYVRNPSVILDQSSYKMWYRGSQPLGAGSKEYSISYATSSDGLHWLKYDANPVLTVNATNTNAFFIKQPSVIRLHSVYLMAMAVDAYISYALSSDGIHWNSTGAPLLVGVNNTSSWQYLVDYPSLVYKGTNLVLFYTGFSEFVNSSLRPSIGIAYCNFLSIPLTLTTTLTVTQTSVATKSVTITNTVTRTEQKVPEPGVFEVSTLVLSIALVVIIASYAFKFRR